MPQDYVDASKVYNFLIINATSQKAHHLRKKAYLSIT